MTIEFIAIGTSLGGVCALSRLFAALPNDFPIPIAAVMHRAPTTYDYLINTLQKATAIKVQEANDKLPISSHSITIAPANYHLLVDNVHYALSLEAPVEYSRPSIDVLFESVADEFGQSALGILLTGGGNDGVRGLKKIKRQNGSVLIQCPVEAENSSLPQAAIDAGVVNGGLPLDRLTVELLALCAPILSAG